MNLDPFAVLFTGALASLFANPLGLLKNLVKSFAKDIFCFFSENV